MNWGPISLALAQPDLRDDIEDVTDQSWLTLAWSLDEFSARLNEPSALQSIETVQTPRLVHQLELLRMYVSALGLDTTGWNSRILRSQLEHAVEQLRGRLTTKEAPDDASFSTLLENDRLALYDEAVAHARNFEFDDSEAPAVLNLAESCFDVMTALERLHPVASFSQLA